MSAAASAVPPAVPPAARDLAAALPEAAAALEAALDALLPPAPPGDAGRLAAAMRHGALGGGKRLRGFLVLEGARLLGAPPARAVRVAAALEMVHAYSLVHDDLPAMDDDALRRGRPTVHVAFDEATAVLAGDALQTRAFAVLADPATHPDGAVRAALVLGLALAAGDEGMCGGQMLDMRAEAGGVPPDEAAVLHFQRLKTGRLIEAAAEAGAVLAGAPADARGALAAYGRELGAAFQIADDVLDATATPEEAGKATGKDAGAGKATLVGLLGLDGARARARACAARALARLEAFGPEAGPLRQLAAYTIERRS